MPKNGVGGGACRTRKLGGAAAAGVPSFRLVPAGRTKGDGPVMPCVKIVRTTKSENDRKASLIFDGFAFGSSLATSSTLGLSVLLLLLLMLFLFEASSSSCSLSSLSSQELVWRKKLM